MTTATRHWDVRLELVETEDYCEVVAHLVAREVEGGASPQDAVATVLPRLHGAFAIESTPSGDQVVLQCNELAQTTSALDVSRAISQLAWQADKVEEKLTGEDNH